MMKKIDSFIPFVLPILLLSKKNILSNIDLLSYILTNDNLCNFAYADPKKGSGCANMRTCDGCAFGYDDKKNIYNTYRERDNAVLDYLVEQEIVNVLSPVTITEDCDKFEVPHLLLPGNYKLPKKVLEKELLNMILRSNDTLCDYIAHMSHETATSRQCGLENCNKCILNISNEITSMDKRLHILNKILLVKLKEG